MSLGDKLRLLRAQRAGITPFDIETSLAELPRGMYRQMEQRYRAVGDDASIRILAEYYDVPYDELRWRLDWPRKALSRACVHVQQENVPLTVRLWNDQTLTGRLKWWDLGAVLLETAEGEFVVQRHAVERWEPRAPDDMRAEEDEGEDEPVE